MSKTTWLCVLAGATLVLAGCDKGAESGAKAEGSAAATATATAAASGGKSFEDLKAELDKTFNGVNTANAGDVDAAIAKFKAAAGAPAKTDGKKDFWYGKMKDGNCGEVWTLAGGGFGSGPTDAGNCK